MKRFNFFRHVRIIGGVMTIVAYFMNNIALSLLGFLVMFFGAVAGVDALEYRVQDLEDKSEEKQNV